MNPTDPDAVVGDDTGAFGLRPIEAAAAMARGRNDRCPHGPRDHRLIDRAEAGSSILHRARGVRGGSIEVARLLVPRSPLGVREASCSVLKTATPF